MSVTVPRPLRVAVRARRAGWRLRVHAGGVLAPVVWGLAMTFAMVLAVAGLAVAVWPIVELFVAGSAESQGAIIALPATASLGGLMIYEAALLGRGGLDFAGAVHHIRLQPAAAPDQVVLAGWRRRSVLDTADLTRVLVRQRHFGLELVWCTSTGTTVVHSAARSSPLNRIDARAMTAWLGEMLAPVPVRHRDATWDWDTDADQDTRRVSGAIVARIWGVPLDEVERLATAREIRTTWTHGGPLFDLYDVEWCTELGQEQ